MKKQNKKATGIGGIFFKCENPEKVKEWYHKNTGLVINEYGSLFEFGNKPGKHGYLQWSPFSKDTDYFKPSSNDFMSNYRVENLAGLVEELKKNGVKILDTIEEYDYGKFIHILDPEDNKIELWEPADAALNKNVQGKTIS